MAIEGIFCEQKCENNLKGKLIRFFSTPLVILTLGAIVSVGAVIYVPDYIKKESNETKQRIFRAYDLNNNSVWEKEEAHNYILKKE